MYATKIYTDRQRTVNYQGDDTQVQTYQCSNCESYFLIDCEAKVDYCPSCGAKFIDIDDISH